MYADWKIKPGLSVWLSQNLFMPIFAMFYYFHVDVTFLEQ